MASFNKFEINPLPPQKRDVWEDICPINRFVLFLRSSLFFLMYVLTVQDPNMAFVWEQILQMIVLKH